MNETYTSRHRILDAAAFMMRTKGLRSTKLSDIAERAGMLAPSIYHHFASKDQLVEEVMMEGIYRNTRRIVASVEVLGPQAPPLKRLEAAIKGHIDFLLSGDDYSSAVARVFEDLSDDMKRRVLAAYAAFDNYWRDLLVAAQRSGAGRTTLDPTLVRKFLIPMLNSCSSWYKTGKLTPEQIAQQATDFVMRGFAAD